MDCMVVSADGVIEIVGNVYEDEDEDGTLNE